MGLAKPADAEPKPDFRRKLARCCALLLARIYECLPLKCPKCGEPMRIIAFVLDQTPATADWPEMDQTAGQGGGWE